MGPTFGGINLEDIKAPECFIIEQAFKERMDIPVFHDDQHGTAVILCRRSDQCFASVRKENSRRKNCSQWGRVLLGLHALNY